MSMTDPIADLLTRIRNGHMSRHETVNVPSSRIKAEIARILVDEGYLTGVEQVEAAGRPVLKIQLKYDKEGRKAITGIERRSRPGRRLYRGKDAIPAVMDGLGVTIVSTSRGVMTGSACRKLGLGGEVLCSVW